MKIGIRIKIDATKIDKARLFEGKNGAKYLDLTTFIDTDNPSQYGDHGFISQSVSKEEREQKVQTPILGNTKVFYSDLPQAQVQSGGFQQQAAPQQAPQQAPPMAVNFDDDIPF